MYAFEYGNEMVMLKYLKNKNGGNPGFSLHDTNGEFILSICATESGGIMIRSNQCIHMDD